MAVENYTKSSPLVTTIKDRYALTKPGSTKKTYHIVLELEGSGFEYSPGDCIGVICQNDPHVVQRSLEVLKASGEEEIHDKRRNETVSLREFLTKRANITEVSRKFVTEIGTRQTNTSKKDRINHLFESGNKKQLKAFLNDQELWDILKSNKEVSFEKQELCDLLMPMLPRLYSIASSQGVVGNEVHLTVGLLKFHSAGFHRCGVCTHYLCRLTNPNESHLTIYRHHHTGFTLPENPETPIIMVGPGTGIAPYRSFMQERMLRGDQGKNWLFFGERNRLTDFFYEELWQELTNDGKLTLDLAFSRDQDHKVYVQHLMWEKGAELFSWLQDGANFYVCGDAQNMAKDVDATLVKIVEKHGQMDPQEAKQYVKQLRKDNRYLRDVY